MSSLHIWARLSAGFTWLLALGWFWQALQWFLHRNELADLTVNSAPSQNEAQSDISGSLQTGGPDLTIVVPACNEEAAIAATLRSLLASERIRLQIFAIDDRSTDGTGKIMDEILDETMHQIHADSLHETSSTSCPHTLEILHISELPPGWLGKPHALAAGARDGKAEWLLFTDGDVSFAPDALQRALRYAKAEQADHLVLMPDWITKTHGEAAMLGAIHTLSAWSLRLWRVADPAARDFIGVGAFNLVRRSAYEALGGFAALRMEVIEDMRLGWMLKRAGYRQRVAIGPGLVSIRWSVGTLGVVRNLEKNLFAAYRFRSLVAVAACIGLLIQIAWPPAAIAVGGWSRLAAILLYLSITGIYIASRRLTGVPPAYVLVYPLAAAVFLLAHVRSVGLALLRGGVLWRGTLYPLKDLRAHAGRLW